MWSRRRACDVDVEAISISGSGMILVEVFVQLGFRVVFGITQSTDAVVLWSCGNGAFGRCGHGLGREFPHNKDARITV